MGSVLDGLPTVTITLLREEYTRGRGGGSTATPTQAARTAAGLATSSDVVIYQLSDRERIQYGVRGDAVVWMIMSAIDPQVDPRDWITFADWNGATHTAHVTTRSSWIAWGEDVYQFTAEDVTTEE